MSRAEPFVWVKWMPNQDGTSTAYYICGALTPDDDSWKPLYEHPPCEHCASAEQIPGPAPESMAEGE